MHMANFEGPLASITFQLFWGPVEGYSKGPKLSGIQMVSVQMILSKLSANFNTSQVAWLTIGKP